MTNEEILNGILDTNYSKISKSLMEVFGKQYKYQIYRILREITFYGYATNKDAIDCCNHIIGELLIELDKFETLDDIQQIIERDKITYLKKRIDTLRKIIDELEVKDIRKNNELVVANYLFDEELDNLIASFPTKTQFVLKHSEDYREQLKNYIIFNDPEDIKMTSSYREFFEDIFFPLLQPNDDIMEFPEFQKIIECIKNREEIYKRANDPELDAIQNASFDRVVKRLHGLYPSKRDKEDVNDRFFNYFLNKPTVAGTHTGYFNLDGEVNSIIGLVLSKETNDIHIIHEIIHALSSFICQDSVQSGFSKEYRNFNEIVTQWLAQLVAHEYFNKFPPIFSKKDNCSYNQGVKAIENFLILHKDDLIKAFMANDLEAFIQKIGKDTMKEIDRILGNYIKFSNVDHFKNPHLREDAEWLRMLDQNAEFELSQQQ